MNAIRMELARLLEWRRWGVVGLVIGAAGIVTAYGLAGDAAQSGVAVNQWDVPLFALNHAIIVPWLLVPAFVGLVGDVVLRDRWTRYAMLSLPRVGGRSRWWAGKLGAIVIAAVLYYLGVVAILSLTGLLFTGAGWSLSPYGQAEPQILSQTPIVFKHHAPPPFAGLPLVGVVLVAVYTAIATCGFVIPIVAIAQAWPRAWVPLTLTFVAVAAFFVTTPTTGLHPLIHLFWDYHNFGLRSYAVDWWISALFIGIECVVGAILGALILRFSDI